MVKVWTKEVLLADLDEEFELYYCKKCKHNHFPGGKIYDRHLEFIGIKPYIPKNIVYPEGHLNNYIDDGEDQAKMSDIDAKTLGYKDLKDYKRAYEEMRKNA